MNQARKPLTVDRLGDQAAKLRADLSSRIVGQEEAVEQVVRSFQTYLAGMHPPGRPLGNFLFLGPTGVGKTRIVEALAELLLGDASAAVKIDCAEFQRSHEVAKLVGAPPGYVGHRESNPLLSQENLDQHHTKDCQLSFVLFDEIEKASEALWHLLLGILDKAALTLGDGQRVNFAHSFIFMTSNLGSAEMSKMIAPRMGFAGQAAASDRAPWERMASAGVEAARRNFSPEFINRLDKIVVFRSLESEALSRILDLELASVQERVFRSTKAVPFVFRCTDEAKAYLLREGTDLKYGARHLKRAVERHVVSALSNLMATGQVNEGDLICLDLQEGVEHLACFREAETLPMSAMCAGEPAAAAARAVPAEQAVGEEPARRRRSS